MKRLFNVMAVLVAVSALAASCAKPALESTENGSVNSGLYDGPVKTLTFDAVIGELPTKTSLGNPVTGEDGTVTIPILWENGDKVDVHWKNGEESASATGEITVDELTGNATFSVEIPESLSDETVFYAVYPSGTTASLSPESGEFQIIIPTYTGTFKEANIMVARCSNAKQAPAFAFKHACGIIRLETGAHAFKNGKRVDRISFYNGTRTRFKGYVSFDFPSDNQISVNTKTGTSDKYVNAEKVDPYSECYFPVFPDYEFEKGFIVSFYNEQLAAYSEKTFTIARGEILNLGNVEARINDHRDFYFKPTASGTGDATSWENAGDIAKLRELLTEVEDSDAAYAQRIKLDNTNYHFMQGEYQLAEGGEGAQRFDLKYTIASRGFSTPLNFYGGYSSADPTVRDPQTYETVFTGNKQYAILAVRDRVILNLDGIVFEKAYAKNAFGADELLGAALYVARSVDANNMPEVHVNNCVFRDNQESDVELNANNGGGSAINLKAGKVYVNNCLFKDNTAYNRGCLIASKSAIEGSVLFINACRFTGNAIKTNYGSVIRSEHQGVKLGINGCSFGQNDCGDVCNSQVTICSPFVFTNNTLIEDASRFKSTSSVGILRMNFGAASTGGVCANNIVLDCSEGQADVDKSVYYAGKYAVTMKYMANLMGGHKQDNSSYHTNVDLLGGDSYAASSKTGLHPSNFESLSYNTAANYWTWTGNIVGVDNLTFQKVSAENMIMATRAQETVGDDFYNWLVKIGAIVDGKFTDCRGYIRPTDAMCPGAYDPNAQPTL